MYKKITASQLTLEEKLHKNLKQNTPNGYSKETMKTIEGFVVKLDTPFLSLCINVLSLFALLYFSSITLLPALCLTVGYLFFINELNEITTNGVILLFYAFVSVPKGLNDAVDLVRTQNYQVPLLNYAQELEPPQQEEQHRPEQQADEVVQMDNVVNNEQEKPKQTDVEVPLGTNELGVTLPNPFQVSSGH